MQGMAEDAFLATYSAGGSIYKEWLKITFLAAYLAGEVLGEKKAVVQRGWNILVNSVLGLKQEYSVM
jgi:hypothetical protein